MFATPGGRLYGGDFGSSFVGRFTEADGVISAECMMSRHYHDPGYVPMFNVDNIALNYTGVRRGEEIHFEGGSAALPGLLFTIVLTPINDAEAPPPATVEQRHPQRALSFTWACSSADAANRRMSA